MMARLIIITNSPVWTIINLSKDASIYVYKTQ